MIGSGNKPLAAIVHYHLRTGGVSTVVERTLAASPDSSFDFVVVTGEKPQYGNMADSQLVLIPELNYGTNYDPDLTLNLIAERIREKAGRSPDLWHFHNHSLGKNGSIPRLVAKLAEEGAKIVLQPHDFAEDGRPSNFKALKDWLHDPDGVLYPIAQNVHYAPLNQRDKRCLIGAGIPEKYITVHPNPVSVPEIDVKSASDSSLILYPTRAIRRKNIGEMILWSAIDPDHEYALTLEPKNPEQKVFYNGWLSFAKKEQIPVLFNYAQSSGRSFEENISHAKALITTSIVEGFGLAFIEPWLFKKALWGRNIPEITQDFSENGLDLSSLYQEVQIPASLWEKSRLYDLFRSSIADQLYTYGLDKSAIEKAEEHVSITEFIDFGRLNEELQRSAIRQISSDKMLRHNTFSQLEKTMDCSEDRIQHNFEVVKEHFSVQSYMNRLQRMYLNLLNASAEKPEFASSTRLIHQFVHPNTFSLLRT